MRQIVQDNRDVRQFHFAPGNTSTFSASNRALLEADYGVKFVTPTELAKSNLVSVQSVDAGWHQLPNRRGRSKPTRLEPFHQ
jgi:hypothetical protein